jgi:hypothetical protein
VDKPASSFKRLLRHFHFLFPPTSLLNLFVWLRANCILALLKCKELLALRETVRQSIPESPRLSAGCRSQQELENQLLGRSDNSSPHCPNWKCPFCGSASIYLSIYIYIYKFYIIKGSWEAILPCYGQIEFCDLK